LRNNLKYFGKKLLRGGVCISASHGFYDCQGRSSKRAKVFYVPGHLQLLFHGMGEGGIFFSTTLLKLLINATLKMGTVVPERPCCGASPHSVHFDGNKPKFLLGSAVFIMSHLCACNVE